MKFIYIFCISILLLWATFISTTHANPCAKSSHLPSPQELRSAVDECLSVRNSWGNPNSITDFVCPSWNFLHGTQQPLYDEVVAYLVAVNVTFNKLDENVIKHMKKLRKAREKDPTKWVENIRECVNGIGEKTGTGIEQLYNHVCDFGTIEQRLNEWSDKKYTQTTDLYPQRLCREKARKKVQWWVNLGYINMSDGINKNQQNHTDSWTSEVTWSYTRIIRLWHDYQKILARAVSKMTGYNREVVWG